MVLFGKKLAEAKTWHKLNMETLQRTANRGSVSTGPYQIDNSLKFEPDNSEYIYRTPSSAGNRRTWTLSFWLKRTELGASMRIFEAWDGSTGTSALFTDADLFILDLNAGSNYFTSSGAFRDTAAWYHFVIRVDTTSGTASERARVYVNGSELAGSWNSNIGQNTDLTWNQDVAHNFARFHNNDSFVSGYYAEIINVDGTSLAPTAFGEVDEDSGIWIPIDASPTYGTNGFKLEFKTAGGLGADTSGNGHTWTLNAIAAADQSTDTPTNSFCTLNTLSYNHPITLTEGNTKYVKSDSTYGMISGTHYVGAGKWYWEVKATDFGTYSACHFGILDAKKPTVTANERGYEDPSLAATNPEILVMSGAPNNWVMNSNATITNNGAMSSVDYTFNEGDILAIALDMDNGAFWFGNSRYSGVANGSFWVAPGGTSTSGSVATTDPTNGNYALVGDGGGTNNGTPNFNGGTITGGSLLTAGFTLVTPIMGAFHDGVSVTLEANFGGYNSYAEDGGYADANGHGNFAYAVPSGFYAICTKNIAEFGGSG